MAIIINGDTGISPVTASGTSASVDGMTVGRGGGEVSTNTAVGASALQANSTGASNTVTGYQAAYSMTGNWASAFGRQALYTNTSGEFNTAIGGQALYTNSTGSNNVAIGHTALALNTTASNNTAVGYQAGYSNTTGADNIAIGYQAGYYITTGSYNVMLGDGVMNATSSGVAASNTVAVGYQALRFNNANDNTAVGFGSAYANTTGAYNTAIGRSALTSNTTANFNTAVGYEAAKTNTTGNVTAIGWRALQANTTGIQNTAVGGREGSGYGTLHSNTTGSYNTAMGDGALAFNTTANASTAIGYQALYTSNRTADTTAYNTALGVQAGYALTTGNANTFIGQQSGNVITTGSNNTIIGSYGGNSGGLDIRTGSNYIVLSDGGGTPRGYFTDTGKFIIGATASSADRFLVNGPAAFGQSTDTNVYVSFLGSTNYLGGSGTIRMNVGSGGVQLTSGATSWASASDERLKDIIEPITDAMAKVGTLRTVMGKYKTDAEGTRRPFLIAQDVIAVLPEAVDSVADTREGDETEYLSVRYTDTIPLLVAAIKEQQAIITQLTERITALEGA